MKLKRLLAVSAAVCCLLTVFTLAGCQSSEKQKAKITIDLKTNPSTGYDWVVENDKKINLLGTEALSEASTNKTGVPHTARFTFEPVSEGETSVIFNYKRDWEGGGTAYTVTYKFTIGSDLSVKFVEATPAAVDGSIEGVDFPDPVIG